MPTPVISANTFYEYTNEMFGSFSGGTWVPSVGNVPHPVYPTTSGGTETVAIQMNAVTLGGFNGINN